MERSPDGKLVNWTPEDREKAGKESYQFFCATKTLGFLSPPWESLPEEVKESYRVYGQTHSI